MNKTAIRSIEKWLRMHKVHRDVSCPFPDEGEAIRSKSKIENRNYHNRDKLCHEVFPELDACDGECPCGEYPVDTVSKRARKFVKAWKLKHYVAATRRSMKARGLG